MSNDKAVELTQALARGPFAQVVEVYENSRIIAIPSDECFALAATLIDTALAQARLEGAKAMQEAAALAGDYVYQCELSVLETVGSRIRALDPQQVINESMGK
jgi:hypothetical protein